MSIEVTEQASILPFDATNLTQKLASLNQTLTLNIGKLRELVNDYETNPVLSNCSHVKSSTEKIFKAIEVYDVVLKSNCNLISNLAKFNTTTSETTVCDEFSKPDADTVPVLSAAPHALTPIKTADLSPAQTPSETPTSTSVPTRSSVADRKKIFENENKQPVTPMNVTSNKKRGSSSGESPSGSFTFAPPTTTQSAAVAELNTTDSDEPAQSQSIQDRLRELQERQSADKEKNTNTKLTKSAQIADELSGVNVKEAASTTILIQAAVVEPRTSFVRNEEPEEAEGTDSVSESLVAAAADNGSQSQTEVQAQEEREVVPSPTEQQTASNDPPAKLSQSQNKKKKKAQKQKAFNENA